MIRILTVAMALVSVSAYATPKLGDYAAFDATLTMGENTLEASVQQEIVQFDESKNEFLERQTVQLSGQEPEVTDSWKAAGEYLDDATIDAVLANCASAGGSPQTVTVAAGSFNACAVNFDNEESRGTAWIAKVPFGVVQAVNITKSNGLTVVMRLRSYR